MTGKKLADLTVEEFVALYEKALQERECRYSLDPEIVHQISYEAKLLGDGEEAKGLAIWLENHRAVYNLRRAWNTTTTWVGRTIVGAIVLAVLSMLALGYRELTK